VVTAQTLIGNYKKVTASQKKFTLN